MKLRTAGLKGGKLDVALYRVLGCIPGNIPEAAAQLYNRDDRDELLVAMPVFDDCGA